MRKRPPSTVRSARRSGKVVTGDAALGLLESGPRMVLPTCGFRRRSAFAPGVGVNRRPALGSLPSLVQRPHSFPSVTSAQDLRQSIFQCRCAHGALGVRMISAVGFSGIECANRHEFSIQRAKHNTDLWGKRAAELDDGDGMSGRAGFRWSIGLSNPSVNGVAIDRTLSCGPSRSLRRSDLHGLGEDEGRRDSFAPAPISRIRER